MAATAALVVLGGCTFSARPTGNHPPESTGPPTTEAPLPDTLPELVPAIRPILERGVPEPLPDYDRLIRACVQLSRVHAVARDAAPGSPERAGLSDEDLAAVRAAADVCTTDPKGAAAKLAPLEGKLREI
jgi:hypothetical protein